MTEPSGTAPLVTVRGEAHLEGPPDLASLTLTLHASGDSSERTRSQLAEGSTAVSELLKQWEAAIERSSTSGLHVAPVFNRRTPAKITGYQGTFTTQFVVADLESLSPLVLALTELPNSQVDGPWWSLRPETQCSVTYGSQRSLTLAAVRTTMRPHSAQQLQILLRFQILTAVLPAHGKCVRLPWQEEPTRPHSIFSPPHKPCRVKLLCVSV